MKNKSIQLFQSVIAQAGIAGALGAMCTAQTAAVKTSATIPAALDAQELTILLIVAGGLIIFGTTLRWAMALDRERQATESHSQNKADEALEPNVHKEPVAR